MKIVIDNLSLNYVDEGDSEEVVLILHGWGANIQSMRPVSNIIADRYRILMLDLPGFGESEEPATVFDSYDYADLIIKFLNALNIEKATLIGHSFGGKISSIIAAKNPERVKKMVLIDSAGLIPKRGVNYYAKVYSYKVKKWLFNHLPIPDKENRRKKYQEKYGSDDYKNSSGIMRKIMVTVVNENIRDLLKDIKCEVLLIWGENDDATPLYMGEIFEKEIEDSGLVVLKDSGHFSYIDDYFTFSAVINSYL